MCWIDHFSLVMFFPDLLPNKNEVAESTQAGKLPKFPSPDVPTPSVAAQQRPPWQHLPPAELTAKGVGDKQSTLELCLQLRHLVFHLQHLEHLTDDLMVPWCLSTPCSFTGCFKSNINRTVDLILIRNLGCLHHPYDPIIPFDKMISPLFPWTKPESSLSNRNNLSATWVVIGPPNSRSLSSSIFAAQHTSIEKSKKSR